jgi:hypothetical protein
MQTAVVGILSSKTCRQKWKEGEAVDDVFGQGCSKSGCMPFLYDTPNVLKSVKFAEAVCPARLAVEQALALHTDTDSLDTSSSPNWEEAVLERTNKMDVKTMIRGLAVAETESALAFHADLLNVGDLSRKNFSNGEVFSQLGGAVCICTVRIDLSRNEFSSVQLHAPSWHKGFRCTEDSRFIVLWESCLNEFRTEELALEKLFGRCLSYDMRRFKQVVVDDPQYLWRCGS